MSIKHCHVAYLGLGSNLGDREENIRRAIALIAEQVGDVVRQSALYYSEPWGFQSDNAFVNAVICIHTKLAPHRLLRATQRIERLLGKDHRHATERTPVSPISPSAPSSPSSPSTPSSPSSPSSPSAPSAPSAPSSPSTPSTPITPIYHDRPIDIDILLYDDLVLQTPTLTIPHPMMQQRPFVMEPLREIR